MCTASNYITDKHYFGRNFDYEISYNERVTITPRNYEFKYRKIDDVKSHYAIIGIAAGIDEYPLYYDACNEKGLSIAGLNFEGNAVYNDCENNMINIQYSFDSIIKVNIYEDFFINFTEISEILNI